MTIIIADTTSAAKLRNTRSQSTKAMVPINSAELFLVYQQLEFAGAVLAVKYASTVNNTPIIVAPMLHTRKTFCMRLV